MTLYAIPGEFSFLLKSVHANSMKGCSVADPWHFGADSDPRRIRVDLDPDPEPSIFIIDLQDVNKKQNLKKSFSAY
jgi:hypothetical protein